MANSNSRTFAEPKSYLNFARQYFHAAEELSTSKSRVDDTRSYLYFHATELLLKAYLRAHGKEPWNHELGKLLKECSDLGLIVDSEDRYGLQNIVSLLESGDEDMGFRYFTLKSGSIPEMGWTREVVGQLMRAVTAVVDPTGDSKPGVAVKGVLMFGRPVPKD